MKFTKMNARGFSHDLIIVAFVVVFSIAGIGYVVASRANDCSAATVSGSVSGTVSGVVSTTASGAVSGTECDPVSAATSAVSTATETPKSDVPAPAPSTPPTTPSTTVAKATCSISGVPQNPKSGQLLRPIVSITNTGTKRFVPKFTRNTISTSVSGKTTTFVKMTAASVGPGKTTKAYLATYRIPLSATSTKQRTYTITSTNPAFSCSATLNIPS